MINIFIAQDRLTRSSPGRIVALEGRQLLTYRFGKETTSLPLLSMQRAVSTIPRTPARVMRRLRKSRWPSRLFNVVFQVSSRESANWRPLTIPETAVTFIAYGDTVFGARPEKSVPMKVRLANTAINLILAAHKKVGCNTWHEYAQSSRS